MNQPKKSPNAPQSWKQLEIALSLIGIAMEDLKNDEHLRTSLQFQELRLEAASLKRQIRKTRQKWNRIHFSRKS